jgi:hypothetical protein
MIHFSSLVHSSRNKIVAIKRWQRGMDMYVCMYVCMYVRLCSGLVQIILRPHEHNQLPNRKCQQDIDPSQTLYAISGQFQSRPTYKTIFFSESP